MKPCEYFLSDRCNYGNECRFSHGEEVPFSSLQEYQQPDISYVYKLCFHVFYYCIPWTDKCNKLRNE